MWKVAREETVGRLEERVRVQTRSGAMCQRSDGAVRYRLNGPRPYDVSGV